jgi:hypothetical protein
MPLTPISENDERLTIQSCIRALRDINKLEKRSYNFLYLASGFIAHYDIYGFASYYGTAKRLAEDVINNRDTNQWRNFFPGQENYEYYMQKKRIYNAVADEAEKLYPDLAQARQNTWARLLG